MGDGTGAMGNVPQIKQESWWSRQSRVARVTLCALAAIVVCTIGLMAGVATTFDTVVISLCGIAVTPLVLILAFRWFFGRVLWKVRNRLITTYLLMGLAPVVLFGTLVGIAAFVMAGQYATDSALARVNAASQRIRDEAGSAAIFGVQQAAKVKAVVALATPVKGGIEAAKPVADSDDNASQDSMDEVATDDGSPLALMELRGPVWVPLSAPGTKAVPGPLASEPPPIWLRPGFEGIVVDKGVLYLCAEVSAPRNGHIVTVMGSRALTPAELDVLAKGLGRFRLAPGFTHLTEDEAQKNARVKDANQQIENDPDLKRAKKELQNDPDLKAADQAVKKATDLKKDDDAEDQDINDVHPFDMISSSPLPQVKHWYTNPPVVFSTAIPVTTWETGKPVGSMLMVTSRLRLLYRHLFATSAGSGKVVKAILIGLTVFFALLLVVALLMALSLSRTITRSVADLTQGTREIDAGHLEHRIPVRRKDQLGALAGSFNGMAASVSELLVQQREKERLLNELAIAQEVQTTLFPASPAMMGALQVHGTCIAARTVGGDYFDFVFGFETGTGDGAGSVLLALGDISGKGISAALLMSALQSAVRAFSVDCHADKGGAPSPAVLLRLVNEHLFRSTQSARYATLVLAVYDSATHKLTYANGGHLPPLVISKDGTVRRLEVGGAVVGLLAGLEYEEATVEMREGDLLVAFTDGLTEPEKAGEDFGEGRLLEFVRAHMDQPLPELALASLHAVQDWFGEMEQPDDMTIVLARQGPGPARTAGVEATATAN
jgi:sigma-B regulation protein RsbU (phosphoserine phosphatase)